MIKPPIDFDSFTRSTEPNFVFDLRNGQMGHSFDWQDHVGRKLTLFQNLALLPYSYCRSTISFCYGEKRGQPKPDANSAFGLNALCRFEMAIESCFRFVTTTTIKGAKRYQ